MYRLEITKNKSYKFTPKTDELIYIQQGKEVDVRTFNLIDRARRLVELVQIRKKFVGSAYTKCTAFMMVLAKGFGTLRIGEANICSIHAVKDDKSTAMGILRDVFESRLKVSSQLIAVLIDVANIQSEM